MNSVSLTDEEIIHLDGKCSAKVQAVVDAAKARISAVAAMPDCEPHIARLVADVINEARSTQLLIYRPTVIRGCDYCEKRAGYAKHARSGRYHRRGETNYDKPLSIHGIEFASRFVRIAGSIAVGGCAECVTKALPKLRENLATVRAQLPEQLRVDGATRFAREDVLKCKGCGWVGREGLVGRSRTLLGDGSFPSTCPQCQKRREIFGNAVFETIGHEVVELAKEPQ